MQCYSDNESVPRHSKVGGLATVLDITTQTKKQKWNEEKISWHSHPLECVIDLQDKYRCTWY